MIAWRAVPPAWERQRHSPGSGVTDEVSGVIEQFTLLDCQRRVALQPVNRDM